MKKFLTTILLLTSFLLLACNSSNEEEYVDIKYREDSVDISEPRWEYLDTSRSSFIGGAWYDDEEDYMIIELSGIKYHYCSMPESTWRRFKSAESFGSDYNSYIRGEFDCRENPFPSY